MIPALRDALAHFGIVHLFSVDFEFQQLDGDNPRPICLCYRCLLTGETGKVWLWGLRPACPFVMSSRTALSPVTSSPGRPRAERGGKPEPAIMMAPALPSPAAVESVLREAARPAAPAVTKGIPVVEATAAAPAVVEAVWRKLLTAPDIS